MEFKQLNLDTLPINPLIETNSTDYKNQLNIALNTSQAFNNIQSHLKLINNQIQEQPNTVKTLNLILESYLYILLSTSTISNLEGTKLSAYFSKKKKVDRDYFQTIDSDYLEKLQFTNYKVWGTNFGSLGYYLYLNQSKLHFAHPSSLVRLSVEELTKQFNLPEYSNNLLSLFRSDEAKDDFNIYLQSTSLLQELDLLEVLKLTKFYETWLKQVLTWYSTFIENTIENPYKVNTAAYSSFNLLITISQGLVKLGLHSESFKNLAYKFIHQDIDNVLLEGLKLLNNIRRQNEFEILNDVTEEEQLIKQLFVTLKSNNNSEAINTASYRVLSLNLPGGFNTWYVTIAAELINRAFILTYNSSFQNNSISGLSDNASLLTFIDRVYKLIFYAGYCLKKTNLTHLQLLGINLRLLSQLEEDQTVQEYDLLT